MKTDAYIQKTVHQTMDGPLVVCEITSHFSQCYKGNYFECIELINSLNIHTYYQWSIHKVEKD